MATTTDDAFHEIQLNGKQLVFLFMAVVVASVVIFLCGVLVGRGVRAERGPLEATAAPAVPDAAANAAVAATPSGGPTAGNEDLSYPSRLAANSPPSEKLRAGDPPASAPAAPPEPAPASAAATGAPPAAASAAATDEPAGAGFAIQVAASFFMSPLPKYKPMRV